MSGMSGLMAALGGKGKPAPKAPIALTGEADPSVDGEEAGEGEDEPTADPAHFQASAQEAMDALKSGDTAGWADALKACIEMAK